MAAILIHRCEVKGCNRIVAAKDVVVLALSLRGPVGTLDVSAECCGMECATKAIKHGFAGYGAIVPKSKAEKEAEANEDRGTEYLTSED